MEVDIPQIDDPNVDYNLIQPIHQKRTIAFVNHFLLSTVSFLNNFAESCESRLMQFEYKLQKIEASLLILESQLSSIPDLGIENKSITGVTGVEVNIDLPEPEGPVATDTNNSVNLISETNEDETDGNNVDNGYEETQGPKASNDPRYKKFFKMLQFGVPAVAVRLKMDIEGVDPKILDNPNAVIPGYQQVTDETNES